MVPLEDISKTVTLANSDPELGLIRKFLFEEGVNFSKKESKYHYADIIWALNSCDQSEFKKCLYHFESRKFSEGTTWCYDDSLIFLILLGLKKFRIPTNLISEILKVRRSSVESKGITQTFSDINEGSFAIELPYDFIKVVCIRLIDKRKLNREAAEKCYGFLTAPGFFKNLNPFFKLVALRAYALILFDRKPRNYESFEDLIVAISEHKKHLNIRQVFSIIWVLPYKWFLAFCFLFLALIPQIIALIKGVYILLNLILKIFSQIS